MLMRILTVTVSAATALSKIRVSIDVPVAGSCPASIESLPFSTFDTGGIITKVNITLEEPAAGKKFAQEAHLPSAASTYVKSIR